MSDQDKKAIGEAVTAAQYELIRTMTRISPIELKRAADEKVSSDEEKSLSESYDQAMTTIQSLQEEQGANAVYALVLGLAGEVVQQSLMRVKEEDPDISDDDAFADVEDAFTEE